MNHHLRVPRVASTLRYNGKRVEHLSEADWLVDNLAEEGNEVEVHELEPELEEEPEHYDRHQQSTSDLLSTSKEWRTPGAS